MRWLDKSDEAQIIRSSGVFKVAVPDSRQVNKRLSRPKPW
jgi:hypothetical protein